MCVCVFFFLKHQRGVLATRLATVGFISKPRPVLIQPGQPVMCGGETARSSGLWSESSGDAAVCGSLQFVCCQAGPSGGQQKDCSCGDVNGTFCVCACVVVVVVVTLTFICYAPFPP